MLFTVAIAAFVGHGFVDLWPMLTSRRPFQAVLAYVLAGVAGAGLVNYSPLTLTTAFVIASVPHFGMDITKTLTKESWGYGMILIGFASASYFAKAVGATGALFLLTTSLSFATVLQIVLLWGVAQYGPVGLAVYVLVVHMGASLYYAAQQWGGWPIFATWLAATVAIVACAPISRVGPEFLGAGAGIVIAHVVLTARWRK
jgi:heme/copper-type cytochrome/quinol oxidase subunit 4